MKSKIFIIMVLASFIAAGVSGCNLLKKRVEKKEKPEYKVSGRSKTQISVENTNGEIKIFKSDDTLGLITIQAEKIARVRFDDKDKPIDNLDIIIDSTGSVVRVKADYEKSGSGFFNRPDDRKVNFEIRVPANIKVDVDNINGTITMTGLMNDIKVNSVNGSSNFNKCSGSINVDATNGSVSGNFDSTRGINIDVTNGAVKLGGLKNVSANVNASTVNGKVKFNNLNFSNLTAEKKNLSGTLGTGSSLIKISSVNGSITLDANDISLAQDKHNGEFRFNFDFDDDDNTTHNKIRNDTAKTLDSPKTK